MKQSQCQKLAKLISRKRGATAMEIIQAVGTVTPTRRLSDLRAQGWRIELKRVNGTNYHTYHGQPPKVAA